MQGLRLGSGACSPALFRCRGDGGHDFVRVGCKKVVFGPLRRDVAVQASRGCRDKVGRGVVAAASASSTLEQAAVEETADELELVEPDFYRMGYIRHVRAYGIEFKEGPDGIGVYSAKNLPFLQKPRVIMEIPLEIMVTVTAKKPWMFFPDIVPMGHPLFEVINDTNPETDWDIRLASLLLLALDTKDNFWQLYGDYLPGVDDSTSLLLASEDELLELQDADLAQRLREMQQRAESTWQKYWPADAVLKLRRLAREPGRFRWALGMALSRGFTMSMNIGAISQEANMLIPYADMFNHSVEPTCSCRFRKKDRMLEVVINSGQEIKEGQEMTFNYLEQSPNEKIMERYGFSTFANPWDTLKFSGNSKIHLDSFLSSFQIAGMQDEYYYNETDSEKKDPFVDGAVLAAARTLPTWVDKDLPYIPGTEMRSACDLQHECQQMLDGFPTTLEEDIRILEKEGEGRSPRWKAAIKYRIDRKSFMMKLIKCLDIYMDRILY
ncbi:hypothetical protein M758_12G143300 [Ceratodon purpureus]|nr:hypothetical protein M758_12G143300 [Ceratodon purpureus]